MDTFSTILMLTCGTLLMVGVTALSLFIYLKTRKLSWILITGAFTVQFLNMLLGEAMTFIIRENVSMKDIGTVSDVTLLLRTCLNLLVYLLLVGGLYLVLNDTKKNNTVQN